VSPGKEKRVVQHDQSVNEMVEEVLTRQAEFRAKRTGEPFEQAFKAVLGTEAGGQLRQLGDRPHSHRKAHQWQEELAQERLEVQLKHFVGTPNAHMIRSASPPAPDGRYSGMEDFLLEWLEGKEAREEYYARLEQERPTDRRGEVSG
jgi:hypothetical protein